MFRIVAVLIVFLAGVGLRAQERPATLVLEDGRELAGTVVAIDLGSLQLRVGGEVMTLSTRQIRSCLFEGAETAATPAPAAAPAVPAPSTQEPTPAPDPAGTDRARPAGRTSRLHLPLPDPIVAGDEAALPHDLRHRSRFRARLHAIDEAFPWLVPTEPTQWISLSLLLFACMSLIVHCSVSVVGAEAPAFGRSMGLASWYLLTGLLQMALMPSAHVATFGMLIGNTAVALFWLRTLFGVSRGGAMIAFAVQLGFAVLGYGVLELVTSLLGSIDTLPA